MRLKISVAMLSLILVGMLSYAQAANAHNRERKFKENFKIQEIDRPQNKEQDKEQNNIRDRLKEAGLKEEDVKPFFAVIQKAVKQNDVTTLSKTIKYPIKLIDPKGNKIDVPGSKEFLANYPKFATPNWKNAVMRQKYEQLFANWQGVMIGRGEIWFTGVCGNESCSKYELKITGMNPWFAD
jgi:hypothetical protein